MKWWKDHCGFPKSTPEEVKRFQTYDIYAILAIVKDRNPVIGAVGLQAMMHGHNNADTDMCHMTRG